MALPQGIDADNWREKLNLGDKSLDEIIDLLGDVKQQVKLYERMEGFLREALLARMPEGVMEYSTEAYMVQRTVGERVFLDTGKVKEEMGEEWYQAHCKVTPYEMVKLVAVKPSSEGKG